MKKKIVLGILAHVDAGKTTVAEALLYNSNTISKKGRVDNKDTFLDTHSIEKARGITVYSKEANFKLANTDCYLLDTPGHSDFSSDMERAIKVLDMAILVISGLDAVQSHSKTVWELLAEYQIPTLIFVNKMDMALSDKSRVLNDIKKKLSVNALDLKANDFTDNLATLSDKALDHYFEHGNFETEFIAELVNKRAFFPVYFGSALKDIAIDELLNGIDKFSIKKDYPTDFKCQVYKISKDHLNNKLVYLKVLGGTLKVKDIIIKKDQEQIVWQAKVNEIRLYSGNKYQVLQSAEAGMIVAVLGLQDAIIGDYIGFEGKFSTKLNPIYKRRLITNEDSKLTYLKIKELETEQPDLNIYFNEDLKEIEISVSGQVQVEILTTLIQERYGIEVEFSEPNIIYKETIEGTSIGYGHFEPLKHYAEVHVLIEELPRGSGLVVSNEVNEDVLEIGYQKQILRTLKSYSSGVLTDSKLTDLKITLVNGKSNKNHTSMQDFKEASIRALRQGLMKAKSLLLEPYYNFIIEIPLDNLGRVLYDLESKKAVIKENELLENKAIITGSAPVSTLSNYQIDLKSFTKGEGEISLDYSHYDIALNQKEIISKIGYDPLQDPLKACGSVFCKNGSGYLVAHDEVEEHMHLEAYQPNESIENNFSVKERVFSNQISLEEIEKIISGNQSNKKNKKLPSYLRNKKEKVKVNYQSSYKALENYYVVDGYNVIFSWPDLTSIAKDNIEMARSKLIERLNNYVAYRKIKLILVFDAYKVDNHKSEEYIAGLINVVFTKYAQTADTYIEKFSADSKKDYQITVITSDNLEQVVASASGALIISSNKFLDEVRRIEKNIKEYLK